MEFDAFLDKLTEEEPPGGLERDNYWLEVAGHIGGTAASILDAISARRRDDPAIMDFMKAETWKSS